MPKTDQDLFEEIGATGLITQMGQVLDEFVRELRGSNGAKVFREMADNDDVVGAVLMAFNQLSGSASWWVEAASEDADDIRRRDFINDCLHDMNDPFKDTLSEANDMWVYGYSPMEVVFKLRQGPYPGTMKDSDGNEIAVPASKFDDKLIGWHKWAIRAPESLFEWDFDSTGATIGMYHAPPPHYSSVYIPAEKLLLFRTTSSRGNPEGRSFLRNAWRSWFFKKRIQEIEAIGIARDLAGYPVLTAPEGKEIWNTSDSEMQALYTKAFRVIRSIARADKEGMVKPFDWKFELMSSGGSRQFNTDGIIKRYDIRMAATMMADVLLIGEDKVGSYALTTNKSRLLSSALGSQMDRQASLINKKAIPQLLKLNGEPPEAPSPQLKHSEIDVPDLKEIADYVTRLSAAGARMFPDDAMEEHLRKIGKLPSLTEEEPELRHAREWLLGKGDDNEVDNRIVLFESAVERAIMRVAQRMPDEKKIVYMAKGDE